MKKTLLLLLFLLLLAISVAAQEPPPPPPGPPPPPAADLVVTKTGPATAAAGTDVTYTVEVRNIGEVDALAVTLTDQIPEGMFYVSSAAPPGYECVAREVDVVCGGGTLPVGATATFTFVFHINVEAEPGTTFTNIATATSQSPEGNPENNSGSAVTTIPGPPVTDLGVTKSGPTFAGQGTTVTYTITVSNFGAVAATNAQFTDTLPGTMTFSGLTQNPPLNFNCSTPPIGAGGTITCDTASLAPNSTTTFTLMATIPAGTAAGTVFTNSAIVSADNNVNEENDVSTISLTASTVDIVVAKSGPALVNAGGNVAYTITLTNSGPDPALDAFFVDQLPAGTTFVSLTHVSGLVGACQSGTTVSCGFESMPNNSSSTYSLVVRAGDVTSISNTVTGNSANFDPDSTDNSATVVTTVTPSADLAVTKSGPATAIAGTNVVYTIALTNNGVSTASNVSLVDTLPAGTTFVSLTSSGPPFVCVAATCTAATFGPAATATFTLTATVAPGTTGPIVNTVDVASAGTPDPNTTNNRATATTTVSSSADLAVAKSGPVTAAAATNITYTVTATNNGPSTAVTVTLTDTLPTGTTFVSATQTTGSAAFNCVHAAGVVTCTAPSMAPGSATFSITAAIAVSTLGTITNSAQIASATPDPNPANNLATAVTAVGVAAADVSIAKSANTTEAFVGATVIYTIAVNNAGPGSAANVVVTDVLPAGTTLISAPGCTGTTTVTCNAGTLAAGTGTVFRLTVQLPSTPGPVTNTATVTSTTPDLTPNNNASAATVTAAAIPAAIPTLSEWALLLLAAALAAVALRSAS
jgi:uncharacterized repeat protein (TIGR01451 family)